MSRKKFPLHPANPERVCWGCDKYCAANDMMCGNGSDRTQHPVELFGEDWQGWGDEGSGDRLPLRVVPSTVADVRIHQSSTSIGASAADSVMQGVGS